MLSTVSSLRILRGFGKGSFLPLLGLFFFSFFLLRALFPVHLAPVKEAGWTGLETDVLDSLNRYNLQSACELPHPLPSKVLQLWKEPSQRHTLCQLQGWCPPYQHNIFEHNVLIDETTLGLARWPSDCGELH